VEARSVTYAPITVEARRALLDALDALSDQRAALVLVGAQAIYIYTGEADVAMATETKDSDLAIVPRKLAADPLLEVAMERAGFRQDPQFDQPGAWLSRDGYPVDLLVPAKLHTGGGRRGARIPPHSRRAARVVPGLEAAAVDHERREIRALDPADARVISMQVATPAALVVAKLYKIGERHDQAPGRLLDKDAHDLFRLLRAVAAVPVATSLGRLREDPIAGPVTIQALAWLQTLCGSPEALIPKMAGRAEALVGSPTDVAAAMWALAQDLLERLSV
jgi:hypothetical protein